MIAYLDKCLQMPDYCEIKTQWKNTMTPEANETLEKCAMKSAISRRIVWAMFLLSVTISAYCVNQYREFCVVQAELHRHIQQKIDQDDPRVIINSEGVITEWQPGMQRIFGYTAEEAIGKNIDILMPQQKREAHSAGFDAAIQKLDRHAVYHVTCNAIHKSGESFKVSIRSRIRETVDGERFAIADFDLESQTVKVGQVASSKNDKQSQPN